MMQKKYSKTETVDVYDQIIKCDSFIANTTIPGKLTTNKEVTRAFGYRPTKHNKKSKYLIVGTVPSMSGLEEGFYYMSASNSFYEILDMALGYNGVYSQLKSDYLCANINTKSQIGVKIENQLNKDEVVLFDTIRYCRRINSFDSGIVDYKLHDPEEFWKLFTDEMLVILTSDEARRYFIEIFPSLRQTNIPKIKSSKTNIDYEPVRINKKDVLIIQLPSPSFSNTSKNNVKTKEIANIYKKAINGIRIIEVE